LANEGTTTMWKHVAIAGAVGAAVLGTGAAALAVTGATSSSPTPSATSSSATPKNPAAGELKGLRGSKLIQTLGRLEHGEWVTQAKTGDVTHDAVVGSVTAVSPTSITVKAKDGFSASFIVGSDTKVRVKGTGKASISSVKVNDRVVVAGVKSSAGTTANQVLDGGAG
jgi:hypothetical protein